MVAVMPDNGCSVQVVKSPQPKSREIQQKSGCLQPHCKMLVSDKCIVRKDYCGYACKCDGYFSSSFQVWRHVLVPYNWLKIVQSHQSLWKKLLPLLLCGASFHLACTFQMEICSVACWTLTRMLWWCGGHKVCKSPGFARPLGEDCLAVLQFSSLMHNSNQSKVKWIK